MRIPRSIVLPLLASAVAVAAAAAPAAQGPLTPAAPPSPPAVAGQQPLPMAAYPLCPSGYFTIDQSCQTCGTRRPFGGKSCTTCENIWTGDQFTTCSQCDFNLGCPQF